MTAMHELSVAVNQPERTPPKIMAMSIMPGVAIISERPMAPKPAKTPVGYPRLTATIQAATIKAPANKRPGMMPAVKRSAIERLPPAESE